MSRTFESIIEVLEEYLVLLSIGISSGNFDKDPEFKKGVLLALKQLEDIAQRGEKDVVWDVDKDGVSWGGTGYKRGIVEGSWSTLGSKSGDFSDMYVGMDYFGSKSDDKISFSSKFQKERLLYGHTLTEMDLGIYVRNEHQDWEYANFLKEN